MDIGYGDKCATESESDEGPYLPRALSFNLMFVSASYVTSYRSVDQMTLQHSEFDTLIFHQNPRSVCTRVADDDSVSLRLPLSSMGGHGVT
jgi:hypothetical protein